MTSTLCWIAFDAVVKNTPACREQKWPKTAAIFLLKSSPRSSLLTSVSVQFSVYTTQESVTKTYPICDDSLSRPKQHSIAPVKKIDPKSAFCGYEQKPYPICFLVSSTRAIRYINIFLFISIIKCTLNL